MKRTHERTKMTRRTNPTPRGGSQPHMRTRQGVQPTTRSGARRSGSHSGGSSRSAGVGAYQTRPARAPKRKRGLSRGAIRFTLIGIAAIAAFIGGGVLLWMNRGVNVSLNGEQTQVRVSESLAQIVSGHNISVAPGDLVSVSGKVLTEGEGKPFSATVDGRELSDEELESFRAAGNEEIVISDGADVMEPHATEYREIQPKLESYENFGAITYVAQWGRVGKQEILTGEISGETADGEMVEPVQNAVIGSLNPQPADGSKVIALTFDDGPSSYTQTYLDILDKYGIHATFFCLGTAAAANPAQVKAIEDQGSQVASHTYSHNNPLTTLSAESLASEVGDAFTAISDSGAAPTTVLRPPYGELTMDTWLKGGGAFSASIHWNLDSEDWRLPGVDAIVSNCTKNAYSGAIILMHDGGGNRDQDVQALPQIIETLQAEGYQFVTIDELMKLDGNIPEDVCSGNATLPEGCVWPTELA